MYLFESRVVDYFYNFYFFCFSEFRYLDMEMKLISKLNGGWF